jgi:hypothetical protein
MEAERPARSECRRPRCLRGEPREHNSIVGRGCSPFETEKWFAWPRRRLPADTDGGLTPRRDAHLSFARSRTGSTTSTALSQDPLSRRPRHLIRSVLPGRGFCSGPTVSRSSRFPSSSPSATLRKPWIDANGWATSDRHRFACIGSCSLLKALDVRPVGTLGGAILAVILAQQLPAAHTPPGEWPLGSAMPSGSLRARNGRSSRGVPATRQVARHPAVRALIRSASPSPSPSPSPSTRAKRLPDGRKPSQRLALALRRCQETPLGLSCHGHRRARGVPRHASGRAIRSPARRP